MQAIAIQKYGGPEVLESLDLPQPKISPSQVLVRLRAAGVNPVDFKIRQGLLAERLPSEFPIVLGWDGAGEIEAVGAKVQGFQPGDRIMTYARKDKIHEGTYATFVALEPKHLAPMPRNLSFPEAAVVPLATLTAYQALFESLQLKSGESLLLPGASGGVGGYALQLAVHAGARVVALASKSKHERLKQWGAQAVLDYHDSGYEAALRDAVPEGFEALFDTVGGATQLALAAFLKPGGKLTSILALQEALDQDYQVKSDYVFVRPDSEQLGKISRMIEAETLKLPPVQTMPLTQAAEAHKLLEQGKVNGKLALEIP